MRPFGFGWPEFGSEFGSDLAQESIGGVPVGSEGQPGTIYAGYVLADGDDFDTTSPADFLHPTNGNGLYMTTRQYGVQSGAPRYLRGAASLGGYEADPWHTGFNNANRGVVPETFADMITIQDGTIKLKSRAATPTEKTVMGPLEGKNNLSSMVHMGRRNMMRAPCIMEMRIRFPHNLPSWNQWHPTFWLLQSQPGNGFDGMELDCEGFTPELEFYRHMWLNGTVAYGQLTGKTAPVSKTDYRVFSFEILEVSGVWRVRLWENGNIVGETDATYGGRVFDPTRPFHLMFTNHILQSNLNQAVFDAAGMQGADMECDWWRSWKPAIGAFRKPLKGPETFLVNFNTDFSFDLGTPQSLWGSDVANDVVEMIPNEDTTPSAPWVRPLLPASVIRTGNVIAGKVSDFAGRLVLARSATPNTGDGCVPQPITICVGPVINMSDLTTEAGKPLSLDVYAACSCGDLFMGKTVQVTGLSGSGLAYNSTTGLLTGNPVLGSYSVTVTTTNHVGQTASKVIQVVVNPPAIPPDYEAWTGPGWIDFSDSTSIATSGTAVTGVTNKRGNKPLIKSGAAITMQKAAYNGRDAGRFARNTGEPARLSAPSTDILSTMFAGDDTPYLVITVYAPRDANTGFIWSSSEQTPPSNISLVRRAATPPSIRREAAGGATLDVSWGAGQAAPTPRIVAVRYTGAAVTVWDNSTTKVVVDAPQNSAPVAAGSTFRIGAAAAPTGNYYYGLACEMDFMECIVESQFHADVEVVKAITQLSEKWGITLS